jgi:nucleoside-diphosphate-sugar epimerase
VRVLISGCGYVGTALGLLLAGHSERHEVFGLRRNAGALPPGIRSVRADLSQPLPPNALPEALDAVVLAASPGGPSDEAYETAYVGGPRRLLTVLAERGDEVRRVVLVSSTGVYGQKGGEWVDEDSPTEPAAPSGRRILEGEGLVLNGPFPATVLRLGGIYGPGRVGGILRALHGLSDPAGDEPPRYTNRIHRDDCAGALRHLLLLEDPKPVYLGVDHEPADRQTVARWLAARTGARPEKRPSGAAGRGAEPSARSNKRCSNRRLVGSGYEFRYPTFREGFEPLLREAGLL